MLRELRDVRQDPGERFRRWFTDEYFDLIVWYEGREIYGFQLCYDTRGRERAFTWIRKSGSTHKRIDDGEATASKRMTPILVRDGIFDRELVAARFAAACADIDPAVAGLVSDVLRDYRSPGAPQT